MVFVFEPLPRLLDLHKDHTLCILYVPEPYPLTLNPGPWRSVHLQAKYEDFAKNNETGLRDIAKIQAQADQQVASLSKQLETKEGEIKRLRAEHGSERKRLEKVGVGGGEYGYVCMYRIQRICPCIYLRTKWWVGRPASVGGLAVRVLAWVDEGSAVCVVVMLDLACLHRLQRLMVT